MKKLLSLILLGACLNSVLAEGWHSPSSRFASYDGRGIGGYQGWFRVEGDGSGEGWTPDSGRGLLSAASWPPDFWPDVSDYEKTHSTTLTNQDDSIARVFSFVDQSTTDLHFKLLCGEILFSTQLPAQENNK